MVTVYIELRMVFDFSEEQVDELYTLLIQEFASVATKRNKLAELNLISHHVYHLLTKQFADEKDDAVLSYFQKHNEKSIVQSYESVFESIKAECILQVYQDPSWTHFMIRRRVTTREKLTIKNLFFYTSHKLYYTILRQSTVPSLHTKNLCRLILLIPELLQYIDILLKTKYPTAAIDIQIKMPSTLLGLLKHRDTLVINVPDKKYVKLIEEGVDAYLRKYNFLFARGKRAKRGFDIQSEYGSHNSHTIYVSQSLTYYLYLERYLKNNFPKNAKALTEFLNVNLTIINKWSDKEMMKYILSYRERIKKV